jgi:hypothetical protein
MQPDPHSRSFNENSPAAAVPPLLPASEPKAMDAPPPLAAAAPPPLPPNPSRKSRLGRELIAVLLSLCLGLFLIDAVVSLVDDSLILLFGIHLLAVIRGIVFLFAVLGAIVIYGLMGLTPMIPKRLFLPVALFNPVAGLVVVPLLIYFHGRMQPAAWLISLCQVIVGVSILCWVQGGVKLRWPLVSENRLAARRFSWLNLSGFLLVNVFVLLPAVVVYLVLCAALALDHFSAGFLALRPGGFTVQVRKYARNDGKTIQLVPMSHIGESGFYRQLSQSFPTNSIILLEGVTDNRNFLTNKISYERAAKSLGLAEQQKEFKPSGGKLVRADVDVEQFTQNTIDCLNLVMLIHTKGLNEETLLALTHYSPPPHYEEQLFDDLLNKRNRRLLEELQARLSQSEIFVVPWGAAHMPGIAREIQKSGFRLVETRDYVAIQFRSVRANRKSAEKTGD